MYQSIILTFHWTSRHVKYWENSVFREDSKKYFVDFSLIVST